MTKDPRIDAYIAKAAPFAQPILSHVQALVHATVADLDETLKWSMPHFVYKGKNLAGFAAFKAHAAFMIHGDGRQGDAMGQYGKLTSMADVPSDDVLRGKLLDAKARIDSAGTALKPKAAPKVPKVEIAMPGDFAAALSAMQGVRDRFDELSSSARREYLEWIVSAKRPETRSKRIAQACDQVVEGKKLNSIYENC